MASVTACDGCGKVEQFPIHWLTYERSTGVGITGRGLPNVYCSWACLLPVMERDYERAVRYGWEAAE